jgi:hypothetical protein
VPGALGLGRYDGVVAGGVVAGGSSFWDWIRGYWKGVEKKEKEYDGCRMFHRVHFDCRDVFELLDSGILVICHYLGTLFKGEREEVEAMVTAPF